MATVKRGKHSTSSSSLPHSSAHHPSLPHSLPRTPHEHRTHHLLYLITFLLIVLVLAVFFSFPFSYSPEQPSQTTTDTLSLSLDAVTCQWEQDHFSVCATVAWEGSDLLFAKGYIPGGESLDLSPPQTQSPFTYCQPVGTEEGYRIVRALAYSSAGVVRDISQGVACLGQPQPSASPSLPVAFSSLYTTTTGFRVYPDHPSFPRGSGIFTKTFPGKVESCIYEGSWITNNDPKFHLRNTCHTGRGTFSGTADAYAQSVLNDPDLFKWAGPSQATLNPPATQYDGYSFWMETCDNEYYASNHLPRYGVQGTLEGFGTNTLTFVWNYYDENTKPAVDFFFTLHCKIRTTAT